MEQLLTTGRARSGDLALLIGFGGGLSHAAQVVALPSTPGAARFFDISADDRRFLTVKSKTSDERAEISVVLNWFDELRQKVPVD